MHKPESDIKESIMTTRSKYILGFGVVLGVALLNLNSCSSRMNLSESSRYEQITYELDFPKVEIENENLHSLLDSLIITLESNLVKSSWKESYKPLLTVGVDNDRDVTSIILTANSNYARIFNAPDQNVDNNIQTVAGMMIYGGYQVKVSGNKSLLICSNENDECGCLFKASARELVKITVPTFKTRREAIIYDDRIYIRKKYVLNDRCNFILTSPSD